MDSIVKCHCGSYEYEGKMTWLAGEAHCRGCYKDKYNEVYGKLYAWSDKDYTQQEIEELSKLNIEELQT